MSKEAGYIKIYRGIFDEDAYKERFSPAAAWIDLLLMAEYEDGGSLFHRGQQIALKRGQVAMSESQLAERWGMTYKQTRNLVSGWVSRGQIIKPKPLFPIIEIVNYDKYQNIEKGEQMGNPKGEQMGEQTKAKESCIKEKENILKEKINSHTLSPPVCTQESEFEASFYRELYETKKDWLENIAMKYCFKDGLTQEEVMQRLYNAIREFRAECVRDAHPGHNSLRDLQMHINRTISKFINQQNTSNNERRNEQRGAAVSDKYAARRGTPPSTHFSDHL